MATVARLNPDTLFAALAEPTRLRLLVLLLAGEACVCDLLAALDRPQPVVSRHLGVLRRAGLVHARREGVWMWYRLVEPAAGSEGDLHRALLAAVRAAGAQHPELAEGLARCVASRDSRTCC